jgi:hypothetical protein
MHFGKNRTFLLLPCQKNQKNQKKFTHVKLLLTFLSSDFKSENASHICEVEKKKSEITSRKFKLCFMSRINSEKNSEMTPHDSNKHF